ncbi:MAG: hypothetical protein ACE3JN_13055 [Ectobacillus sp.]
MKRKAATPAGKAARPRPRKASACSGKSTIKFNRAFFLKSYFKYVVNKAQFCVPINNIYKKKGNRVLPYEK